MQIEQKLCSIEGHEGRKLTHFCIEGDYQKISRYICTECIKDISQLDDYNCDLKKGIIEIENFMQYLKDQRLPQIEVKIKAQIKAQNEYQAKLKYMTKVYEKYFHNNDFQVFCNIKQIIQNLMNEYKTNIEQAQLLQDIYNQINLNGLYSLKIKEYNILLNDSQFMNNEIIYYQQINNQIKIFPKYYKQQYQQVFERLRKINDYLDFQEYSINGKQRIINGEEFINNSFFSNTHRYFALIQKNYSILNNKNQLNIRKQNTLDMTQQLIIKTIIKNIKFDPLFKHLIRQDESEIFYFYILKANKLFKLIKKFKQDSVKDFILTNQKHILMFLEDLIVIKQLNCKNQLVNQIKYKQGSFCYGMEKHIIAINDLESIYIYQETQRYPLIFSPVNQEFSDMMFTDNDFQLLTKDKEYIKLWKIDYHNLKITLINKLVLQNSSDYTFMNRTEFNIIRSCLDGDWKIEIEILDKNFNSWFIFKTFCQYKIYQKSFQLTKHFLMIQQKYSIYIIQRRLISDIQRLENDCEKLQ